MGLREIKVKDNEFYRPIHDKTAEQYSNIHRKYEYSALEQAEAKQWDFFRYSDNVYRFNVQLLSLTRVLDEREDAEFLTRTWRISGRSEIGNEKEFIKQFSIDTYVVPKYDTKVVQTSGQSLKTEAGEINRVELKYATPFTFDNIMEAFKDSKPENNLRYVTLRVGTHQGRKALTLQKRYFLAWLIAPIEFIIEYNRTGNKALVDIDIDNLPNKVKGKLTEFQLEKVRKIIDDSNVVFLDDEQAREKERIDKEMAAQGISNEAPRNVEKVRIKKEEIGKTDRNVY